MHKGTPAMDKMINIIRYIGTAIYIFYLLYIFAWNEANHTGLEPLYLLAIPLLLIVIATITKDKQIRNSLIVTSIIMVSISMTVEMTNGMVNYERWLQNGMPDKWSW